jgi:hypothetical protein
MELSILSQLLREVKAQIVTKEETKPLSILSQLLQATLLEENSRCLVDRFQFFPSCCTGAGTSTGNFTKRIFQFFPSCCKKKHVDARWER